MTVPETQQEPITIKTYSTYLDDYGQQHTTYSEKAATMFIRKFAQSASVDDVRYNDVELIGLTKTEMTEQDNIIWQGKEYKVKFTVYTPKWWVIYLKLYEC